LAVTPVNVVITGESGTSKQLVARSIHGSNSALPFLLVDCATICDANAEAEFAQLNRLLECVESEGATVFLRNVDHLGLGAQATLSRIIAGHDERRANRSLPSVRIVASARRDLEMLCRAGSFLPDLCYALSVVSLVTAPLRAIREDIPVLLGYFMSQAAGAHGRAVPIVDRNMPYLLSHPWPGNVRELRNFAFRLVLGLDDGGFAEGRPLCLADQVSWFEKEIIVQQLRRRGGNVEATCEALAVSKTTLYEKMRRHSICPRKLKSEDAFAAAQASRKNGHGSNGAAANFSP
jgi:two-component system C4-dicarboxylate transport response regulator DctD